MPPGVSRRRFKSPYWDVPPVGYEHSTPKEYKALQAAGKVPHSVVNPSSSHLQGTKFAHGHPDPMAAARAAAANINKLLAVGGGVSGGSGGGNAGSGNSKSIAPPAITRQARRLYIGNIPFGCSDDELMEFFQTTMTSRNFVTQPGNPVWACQINTDKNFAFLEFRTVEETTNALALDGVLCKSQALKVRRPHDYQPIPGTELATAPPSVLKSDSTRMPASAGAPNSISTIVADSPNKIYIGGVPTYLTDDQIKDILSSFGQLKAFNLIRDPSTLSSKGYAFCEYADPAITDQAILGLNLIEIGDKKLIVQRASVGAKSGPLAGVAGTGSTATNHTTVNSTSAPVSMPLVQIQVPGLPSITPSSTPRVLTEVLCLMNMVEPDELKDDEEYREIVEDIQDECSKYGTVKSIEIPRPNGDAEVAGLGKVFVEFESATEAQRAQLNLAGRRFANRVVVTSYFDRYRYRNKEF